MIKKRFFRLSPNRARKTKDQAAPKRVASGSPSTLVIRRERPSNRNSTRGEARMNTTTVTRWVGRMAGALAIALASQSTFADCQSMEAQIQAELTQVGQEMSQANDGICNMLRRAMPVFENGVRFYQGCPAADPTGQQAQALQATLQSMQQSAQQVCAN
jgi:hypothetical protein